MVKNRPSPTILIILFLFGFIFSVLILLESTNKTTPSYTEQIERLDSIQDSLDSLSNFITHQKNSLAEKQKLLDIMEQEQKELEPILKANRNEVESIISATNSYNMKNIWHERAIGFFLAIIGTLVVKLFSFLYNRLRQMIA